MSIYRYLFVLERTTRGRQLHLAKCFGPKSAFFSCKKGYITNEVICQVKLSTMCLTLKNQQIH